MTTWIQSCISCESFLLTTFASQQLFLLGVRCGDAGVSLWWLQSKLVQVLLIAERPPSLGTPHWPLAGCHCSRVGLAKGPTCKLSSWIHWFSFTWEVRAEGSCITAGGRWVALGGPGYAGCVGQLECFLRISNLWFLSHCEAIPVKIFIRSYWYHWFNINPSSKGKFLTI